MTVDRLGWILALFAEVSLSVTSPLTRVAVLAGMNPTTLVLARLWIASVLLVSTIALTDPSQFKMDRRGLILCCIAGLANSVSMLCFAWSLTRLNASISMMISSTTPLVVLGMLALRGERFTHRDIARLVLGLGGVYLLIGPGGEVDVLGIILVTISVFTFSIQIVIAQWFLKSYDARRVALYIVLTMTIIISSWWTVQGVGWHSPELAGWLAVGVLAVVCTYLARLAFYAAVARIGGGQTSLFAPLRILLAVTWSILFLHERLTAIQWLGSGLILTSALLAIERLGLMRRHLRWRAGMRP